MAIPHLFRDIKKIESRLRAHGRILLFLDFDGTLTPIVPEPSAAYMSEDMRSVLSDLASRQTIDLAVISGRALGDIISRVDIEGLIYAGNHGLEICGGSLLFEEPTALSLRPTLNFLAECLSFSIARIPGAFVEDKGMTLSVHYRQVPAAYQEELEQTISVSLIPYHGLFSPFRGRKVIEICPLVDWHKGKAVQWIADHIGDSDSISVYLGDDTTDEDAFEDLANGIAVKVGEDSVTSANYYLKDPVEVLGFLHWLEASLEQRWNIS
jgi:trehalose-phosphatase